MDENLKNGAATNMCQTPLSELPGLRRSGLHDTLVNNIKRKRERIGQLMIEIKELEDAVVAIDECPQAERVLEKIGKYL